jgi:hypothetical protein
VLAPRFRKGVSPSEVFRQTSHLQSKRTTSIGCHPTEQITNLLHACLFNLHANRDHRQSIPARRWSPGVYLGAPVMKRIVPFALLTFLVLADQAMAELREKQRSGALPDRTAIPEKFGEPIRERSGELQKRRRRQVPTPIPAPNRTMIPSRAKTKE